jgi:HEAT repeat protein
MPRSRVFGALVVALLSVIAPLRAADKGFLGKPLAKWVDNLSNPDPAVRRSAAFALGKAGSASVYSVPRLARLLKDSQPSVREAAAYALGEIGATTWQDAYPALVSLLTDDGDALVRRSAAFALGRWGLPSDDGAAQSAVQALRRALTDNEASVRQNAAWALGQLGPKSAEVAVGSLCRVLSDADPLVRRDAVAALGKFGLAAGSAATELVARFKDESDPAVRKMALEAVLNVVGPVNKGLGRELRPALGDSDPDIVHSAALSLAKIGGSDAAAAVPVLCELLHEKDTNARRQAAAALGGMGSDAGPAVAILAETLTDRDGVVRRNAALALGRIGEKAGPAVPALAHTFADKDELAEVRKFAGEALTQVGSSVEQAVTTLLRVLKDERDPRIRQNAVMALGRLERFEGLGVAPAFEALLSETEPDGRLVRYAAALWLGIQLGDRAPTKTLDVLAAYLQDKDIQVYLGSSARVGGAGKENRSDTTITPSYQGDPRYQAALALGRIGPKANRPDIVRGLQDTTQSPDPKAREAATEALRRIQK